MKRLAELTVEDLAEVPVWRYEGGSDAEALVVPVRRDSLSQMDDDVFLAATEFELADSARHLGFCFPADDSGIDYLQPVIIAGGRHVGFWFDAPVSADVLAEQWGALGKEPEKVFPVRFKCLVPVDGRTVSGEIPRVEFSEDLAQSAPVAVPLPPPERAAVSRGEGEMARRPRPASSTRWSGAERILKARPIPARMRNSDRVEKRTARRRPVEMAVDFSHDTFHGSGVTGDVSRRGMFVRSNRIPGTGPLLRLTVHLPEGRKLFLTGRVVRSAEASGGFPRPAGTTGFGLRFADESPEYENLLNWLSDESK